MRERLAWELRIQSEGWSAVGAATAKKRKLEGWVENPPESPAAGAVYLEAFWELDTCREIGMGVGPIPWRDLHDYAVSIGLDRISETLFRFFIRQLDAEYLTYQRERQASKGAGTMKDEVVAPNGRKMGGGKSKLKKLRESREGKQSTRRDAHG